MSYINLDGDTKTARAAAIGTNIGNNAVLTIYDQTYPGSPDTTHTGNALVALPLSNPPGSASGGVYTFNAFTQENANATGTALSFRIANSTGHGIVDGDVTATGGGGTLQINTANVATGGPVIITSFAITEA